MPPKRRGREQTDAVSPEMSAPKRQCSDERTLPGPTGPTLLTAGETYNVTLQAGGRRLTGTLRLSEDQAATRDSPSAAGGSLSGARDVPSATGTSLSGDPDPQRSEERLLDLAAMKCNAPNPEKKDLDAALRAARGVTRLLAVGEYEKWWLRQLLMRAADTVQELSVTCTAKEHLSAVQGMRKLRKLELELPDEEWTRDHKEIEGLSPTPEFPKLEWLSLRIFQEHNCHWPAEALTKQAPSLKTMQVVLVAGSTHNAEQCSRQMSFIRRIIKTVAAAVIPTDSFKVLCTACHGEGCEEHI